MGSVLAVQGLGLWAFIDKGAGSILGWGTKIPQTVWCGKNKKLYLQIEIILLLPFQFGYLYACSCLFALARTSRTKLNTVAKVGILVLILKGEAFSLLPLSGFFKYIFYYVKVWIVKLLFLVCWVVFFSLWKNTEFCQLLFFLHQLKWSYVCFFPFIPLMRCVILINIHMLKYPCITGVSSTWSWCVTM